MKLFRPALAALLALSLSSCALFRGSPHADQPAAAPPPAAVVPAPAVAPPATVAASPRPALWKISDEDTTIWLFGTIHVLPPDLQWRSPAIDAATAAADRLVIEVVIDKANPQALAGELLNLGTASGLPPFLDRVPADRRAALQRMIGRSGAPPVLFDSLKTWAGAFMLVGATLRDLGMTDSDSGAENVLQERFRAAARPIEGLETVREQLGFFDTLPEEAQRAFLMSMAENPEDVRREFAAMLAAWTAGDEAAIAATFDDDLELSATLRQVLLHDRNARWTDWLIRRMQQPGKVFVAVGAGHLVGPNSVRAMLEARGVRIERVQ